MSRERMVTRTITSTHATAMVVDVTTAKVSTEFYILAGDFTTEEALKVCKKNYETDTLKIVQIVDVQHVEKLYGMVEDDFLSYAFELDPETRKRI